MLISNLAEPEWMNVNCSTKMLSDVYCASDHTRSTVSMQVPDLNLTCEPNHILKTNSCFVFLWHSALKYQPETLDEVCNKYSTNARSVVNVQISAIFLAVRNAVSGSLSPILYQSEVSSLMIVSEYFRLAHILKTGKERIIAKEDAEGFFVCEKEEENRRPKENEFSCSKGGFISYLFFCDEEINCPNDDSDEKFCECNNTLNWQKCRHVVNQANTKECGHLFFKTPQGKCVHHFHKAQVNPGQLATELNLWNDLIVDQPDNKDETELMGLLLNGTEKPCSQKHQLPCLPGHSRCYNISAVCTYKLDRNSHLFPCRNGGHIEDCKEFECNAKFKCPESYCVPWAYVCDGKIDCPSGSDERNETMCQNIISAIFAQMFVCRNTSSVCIHLNDVCNDEIDCPGSDDEFMCELRDKPCPFECECLSYAVLCFNTTTVHCFHHNSFILAAVSVAIYHSQICEFKHFTTLLNSDILVLKLQNNSIEEICNSHVAESVSVIEITMNKMTKIAKNCLRPLLQLQILRLDQNAISHVESFAFAGLPQVRLLNLSDNSLTRLSSNFISNGTLDVLHISGTDIYLLDTQAIQDVSTEYIVTQDFHLCCIAPKKSACTAQTPWHKSCENLLPNTALFVLFVVVSVCGFALNSVSVLAHVLARKSNTASATVVGVNAADITFILYLGILWIANKHFEGTFPVRENNWRAGVVCTVAFSILLWFSVLSQCTLVLLSLSRLMIVVQPVDTVFKQIKFLVKSVTALFTLSFGVAFGLTVMTKLLEVKIPTKLCSPFLDPTRSVVITVFNIFVVVTQLGSCVAILGMHIGLVYKFIESQKNIQKSKSDDGSKTALIVQLCLMTISNICCWLPADVIHVYSLSVSQYQLDVNIWTTVTVLPLNSLLNPCVLLAFCIRKHIKYGNKDSKGQ